MEGWGPRWPESALLTGVEGHPDGPACAKPRPALDELDPVTLEVQPDRIRHARAHSAVRALSCATVASGSRVGPNPVHTSRRRKPVMYRPFRAVSCLGSPR